MKATRRFFLCSGVPPAYGLPGIVTYTLQMDGPGGSVSIPKLKFGKKGGATITLDDAALSSIDFNAKMSQTFYTDGAGNNKPYTGAFAANGNFQFDNLEVGSEISNSRDSLTYAQQYALIQAGFDEMNHGYYHDQDGSQNPGQGGKWGYGNDPQRNVKEMDDRVFQVHRYKMNAGVVPNADAGFQNAFALIGYITGESTGSFDDWPVIDQFHWPKRMSLFPTDWQFIVQHRDFNQDGISNGSTIWQRVDDLINYMNANPDEECMIAFATHQVNQIEQTSFNALIDSLYSRSNDRVIVCSLREFWEYQYLKNNVGVNIQKVGNAMTVTVDYSSIPQDKRDRLRWYDLSFIVDGAEIQSVLCSDNRFTTSFNASTGLFNGMYQRTDFTENAQPAFNVLMKDFIGSCAVHEDYEHGFDEDALGLARLYTNRNWLEGDIAGDELKFQNSRSGWYFDDSYNQFKGAGVKVLMTVQGLGIESSNTAYIAVNNPGDDTEDPASYSKVADTFGQIAMRYGKVSHPSNTLRSDDKLSGLDLVYCIEVDNEVDRTWHNLPETPGTVEGYYAPEQYAAMLSACYDAIKAADPDMIVSMAGLAGNRNLAYMDAMMDWFKANRTDQKFPADVLAFHLYIFNNSIDWNNPPYPYPLEAESPEDGNMYELAKAWSDWRDLNAPHCQVWCGEFGYDTNAQSPICPRPILQVTGDELKDHLKELQARYIIRSYMELLSAGIDKAQQYELVDPSQDTEGGLYATAGLRSRTLNFAPKPSFTAVQELFQELKDYTFTRIINRSNSYHAVEFRNGNLTKIAAWLPTATNATGTRTIQGIERNLTEDVQIF